MKVHYEKLQRTTDDIIIILTDEEELFRKKFMFEKLDDAEWKCTICAKVTSDKPYPHPALRVSICFNCLNSYENAVFLTNKDGTDKNCRWCSNPAKKYSCSSCTVIFCKDCLERNFDSEFVRSRVANNSDWNCFICYPNPIWRLRAACTKAMEGSKSLNEIEVIDLLSQDSQEERMPLSQLVLTTGETQTFSSDLDEIMSYKIFKSKHNDSFQNKTSFYNNKMSIAHKKFLSIVLKEYENYFLNFTDLFVKRINQLFEKFNGDIGTYLEAIKLVNKVSEFCDKAVENINFIKDKNHLRFELWLKNVTQSNNKCDGASDKSKSPPKDSENIKTVIKKEESPIPSISQSKNTKKGTRKSSLSLKSSSRDLNEQNTLSDSENSQKICINILSDDEISSNYPKHEDLSPIISENSTPLRKTSLDESTHTNSTIQSLTRPPNVNLQEEILPPVIRHVARKRTGPSKSSAKKREAKKFIPNILKKRTIPKTKINPLKQEFLTPNKPQKSPEVETSPISQIKSELNSKTEVSFSQETVLRNSTDINQTLTGSEDLVTRIREDFGEEIEELPPDDFTIRIEHFLCETTGEICQIYKSGPVSDEESNNFVEDFVFSDLSEDDSVKTEEFNKKKRVNNKKVNNFLKVVDEQMLNPENLSQIDEKSDIELLPETQIILEEELFKNNPEKTVKIPEIEIIEKPQENINSPSESSSETSDSEYERTEALKALELETDLSDLESSSSSVDSNDSFYRNRVEPKVLSATGYVKQLDIAAEIAKLRENHLENLNEEDETSSEEEISEENPILEPKLQKPPVVVLDKTCKLTLKPIVLLEKLDLKCLEAIEEKLEETLSVSSENIEDSEEEIRRITDLSSLKKRNITSSSENDSNCSKSRKKRLTKKHKSCAKIPSSDSDSDSSCMSKKSSDSSCMSKKSSDSSCMSKKSETRSYDFQSAIQKDPDFVPPIGEDILNDSVSEGSSTEEEEVIEVNKMTTRKSDDHIENLISDEEEPEKTQKEIDEKSKWRKNKLLTNSLQLSNSDSDVTYDSTANEILQKEEENYLKKADIEKEKKTKSVESINSSDTEDDAIVLSDDDSFSEDDIQFVGLKRNRESEDETEGTATNKKGRRNIREVLKDSELQEETQKADKEEAERKERITLKQRTLDSLLSGSQLSQEEVGYVLDVDEDKKEPLITVHHTLVPRLKEHQKKGIKFLWDACYESVAELKQSLGAGCILAHCMGLGKTMQVVVLAHTLLTHKTTNVKHVLIVCPLSTVFNWRNEFQQTLKVCPKPIQIFDIRPGRQKNFKEKIFEVKRWNLVGGALILGYESFLSLVNEEKLNKIQMEYKKIVLESLINPGPDLVVCDEGHMLKNGKTLRFTSLSKIKTRRRIILTGTPLQNNLIEYYHMVNFVKPHLLGTLEEYKNRFVNPILNGQYEDSNESDINLMKKRSHILHKKLENSVQRYEETELQPYLPKKHDYVLYVQLTPLQILLYEHYLQLPDVKPSKLFKNYHSLQNIWTHPALLKIKLDKRKNPPQKKQKRYDEDFVQALDPDTEFTETNWFEDLLPEDVLTNISYGMKIEILFSVITECEAIKDKLLVFSSSMDELDLIEYFLKQKGKSKGLDYCRMDGTVAPEKRIKYCNDFNNENNPRTRLFLVSHKVGGLGLNLTAANRVILMDVSWNPAYDIQSVFRVYRFGQTKTCYVYRFVSMGTMEEVVYGRAVTKLAISCRVVDEHQIKRHFNSDDLQRMYSLNKEFGDPPLLMLPADRLLTKLWDKHKPFLFKFCDHQMLLQNQTHEELNEEEMKLALEEFTHELEREKLAKETAIMRQQNTMFWPQQYPQNLNYVPQNINYNYQTVPNTTLYQLPLKIQPQSVNLPPSHRFKPPNKLPADRDFQSEHRKYLQSNGNIHRNYSTDESIPSTSSAGLGSSNFPSNSVLNQSYSTRGFSYLAPSTSTFSNASTLANSVNENFSKLRHLFNSEVPVDNKKNLRTNNQPLSLTTNNASLSGSSSIINLASNGQKENISVVVQRNSQNSHKNLAFVANNSNQATPLQDKQVLVRKQFD